MELTKEELNALKLVVDYHIIDALGVSSVEHLNMMNTVSVKLAKMIEDCD